MEKERKKNLLVWYEFGGFVHYEIPDNLNNNKNFYYDVFDNIINHSFNAGSHTLIGSTVLLMRIRYALEISIKLPPHIPRKDYFAVLCKSLFKHV